MGLSAFFSMPAGILALIWFCRRVFQNASSKGRDARHAATLPTRAYLLFSALLGILAVGLISPLIILALGKVRILSPGQAFELANPLVGFVFLGIPCLWLWGIALLVLRKVLSLKTPNLAAT